MTSRECSREISKFCSNSNNSIITQILRYTNHVTNIRGHTVLITTQRAKSPQICSRTTNENIRSHQPTFWVRIRQWFLKAATKSLPVECPPRQQQTITTISMWLVKTLIPWRLLSAMTKLKEMSPLSIQTKAYPIISIRKIIREQRTPLKRNPSSDKSKTLIALYQMISSSTSMRWCKHKWRRFVSSMV